MIRLVKKQTKFIEEEEIRICQGLTLEEAKSKAAEIASFVDAHCYKIKIVGSIRRERALPKDIDFVVISEESEWEKLGKELELMLGAKMVMGGERLKRFLVPHTRGYVQADFYNATDYIWGVYMLIRTGSADHNVWLCKQALRKGMRLRYSAGLVDSDGLVVACETEEEIFKALGLEWIPPPQREMLKGRPVWMK